MSRAEVGNQFGRFGRLVVHDYRHRVDLGTVGQRGGVSPALLVFRTGIVGKYEQRGEASVPFENPDAIPCLTDPHEGFRGHVAVFSQRADDIFDTE